MTASMPPRSYPDRPLVGVGVVVWRDGRVLLVKRARPPCAGQWALPGGAQELGETLFDAARREVLEETALTVEPVSILTAIDLIEFDGDRVRYHYTLVEIAARYVSGEIAAGDDAGAADWFDPDEIAALDAWDQVERMVRLSQQSWINTG
jgi:ADP-ribose pyrophosphatase YjhB (NUDIX family)